MRGGLADAELLARVYLARAGGQAALSLDQQGDDDERAGDEGRRPRRADLELVVIEPSAEEAAAHEAYLRRMQETGPCLWQDLK